MKSPKILAAIATSIAIIGAALPTARAATFALPNDGTWFDFYLAEGTASWLDAASETASFTYTSSTPFVLRVVDYFLPGDSTQVFSNGSQLGTTPSVVFDTTEFADTPDVAFGDSAWSQASWILGAGDYTFTGTPGLLPLGAATMAISVVAVPEPDSLAMLIAGIGVLAATALRPHRQRSVGQ